MVVRAHLPSSLPPLPPLLCSSIDLASPDPPSLFRKTVLKGGYDPAPDFETAQVFATSKDGTRVPMFVTAPKGVALDGSNPTLLYGYGGERRG